MKVKKAHLLVFISLTAFLSLGFVNSRVFMSYLPPLAKTGAPGETTCEMCHGGPVNPWPGEISLRLQPDTNAYLADTVFALTVQVLDTSQRFGFEITAIDTAGNRVGRFRKTDTIRTELRTDQPTGREYISHMNADSIGTWDFEWLPPINDVGPIRFFYAGVGANNDQNFTGDRVYQDSLWLFADSTGSPVGISLPMAGFDLSVYPNPTAGRSMVIFHNPLAQRASLSLHDVNGKLLSRIADKEFRAGGHELELDLTLPDGIYFLILNGENHRASKRIILNRTTD